MRFLQKGLKRVLGMLLIAVAIPWGFDGVSRLPNVLPLAHSASVRERSAEQLYQQGDQLLDANQFDAARQLLQQALKLYQQYHDLAGQTKTLKTLGHTYYYQERYAESLPYYQQSLEVARQIPDLDAQGRALLYLGAAHKGMKQFDLARAFYEQSLQVIRQELRPDTKTRDLESSVLTNLGLIYTGLGQAAKGVELSQQALAIARAIHAPAAELEVLQNLGLAYLTARNATQSITTYQQAVALARQLGERETLNALNFLGNAYATFERFPQAIEVRQQALELARKLPNPVMEGETLHKIATLYLQQGQYAKVLEFAQQALAVARKLPRPSLQQEALQNLGQAYQSLGQYQQAVEQYEQSLALAQDNPLAQKDLLVRLSACYALLGQHDRARHYTQASAKLAGFQELIAQKLPGGSPPSKTEDTLATAETLKTLARQTKNSLTEVMALLSEGSAYEGQKQLDRAEKAYREALDIAQKNDNPQLQSLGWFYLGRLYDTQGESSKALECYQQRVNIAKTLGATPDVASTLYLMGDLQARLGTLDHASATLRESLHFFEALRVGLKDRNNVSLFDTQRGAYQRLQEVLVAQHQPEAALEVAERGRARAYAELLASRLQGVPTLDAPTLSQIRQTAQTQHATLVVYSLVGSLQQHKKQLLIWVIQPSGTVTLRSVELESGRLAQLVKTLRQSIAQGGTDGLQALYQVLIQPIADLLPSHPLDRLIFLPQGDLFLVPFAALADQTGQPLLERHTILTAPSIQVVDLTHQQQQRNQGSSTTGGGLLRPALIVGNPVMPRRGNPPEQLTALPGAETEARSIARLLHTQALVGKQATRAAILQQMPTKRVIHLATHGSFEDLEGKGLPGAIALAPSGRDTGFLTSSDIMDLRLNADLVVLSACDTGRGTITGDGVIGLSRAFLAAGASSLVVSLWSISDESTALLMTQFYQALGQHADKAQALRQTMLFTRARYPQPIHWTAFTLMGDAQ